MEIKVRIAEEKDVERVAMLYEKLHDYLETPSTALRKFQ